MWGFVFLQFESGKKKIFSITQKQGMTSLMTIKRKCLFSFPRQNDFARLLLLFFAMAGQTHISLTTIPRQRVTQAIPSIAFLKISCVRGYQLWQPWVDTQRKSHRGVHITPWSPVQK